MEQCSQHWGLGIGALEMVSRQDLQAWIQIKPQ